MRHQQPPNIAAGDSRAGDREIKGLYLEQISMLVVQPGCIACLQVMTQYKLKVECIFSRLN